MLKFTDLSLAPALIENLNSLGYELPTAIQAEAIPLILKGQDLLGIAQTGTGKTAAFCLPILHRLKENSQSKGLRALVLAPTRELASQIQLSFENYGKGFGIRSTAIFGGVGQKAQVTAIKAGVDIVVATPGRLMDLMDQGQLSLDKVEMLVLDEADRMLDMGFIEDLHFIIQKLPKKRQTLFFSATMPEVVEHLSRKILTNPERVEVSANSSTVLNITQKVYFCTREDKFQLLRKILKEQERVLVIVFTKTKNSADKVREYLLHHRLASTIFYGDKSQEEREKALINFKRGSMKILIATDIAARGIDVQGVSHVINFELPMEAENYVHRIGRTARAGNTGVAISFCEDSEKAHLGRIEALIQLKIPSEKFKGTPEAAGKWMQDGSIRTVKAPTPGLSQEKSVYIDHSKRQRVVAEGAAKPKPHPGFKKKRKKR
jgi:ATP-dependent RNA helicase RhlE